MSSDILSSMNQCQKCQAQFEITADDNAFYEKMGVLAPTLCPKCRAQLRLSFRNERVFYKRVCDRCQKPTISMFSQNKPYPVWCYDCWWADDWDPSVYGQDYDPSRPFFEQFKNLYARVPKPALVSMRGVNCEYLNYAADNKNCYMIVESSNNEDCIHCYWIQLSNNLVDCSFTNKVELSYESDDCYDSFRLQYCRGCHSCTDSYFLLNCRGCANCVGCTNLRQKQYCIFNEQYSKAEYEEKLKSFGFDTTSGVEQFRKQFNEFVKKQPRKYAEITNAVNSTGNYMVNIKNNKNCFHSYDAEDNVYCVHAWRGAKDCMDCNTVGRNAEKMYNTLNTGIDVSNCIGCSVCWGSTFMTYCVNCPSSANCFGCVGMRTKKYAILNKQYSPEEYEKLKAQIVSDMKAQGVYGDFIPKDVSAFGYNESSAAIEFPLSKDEALAQGFKWEDTPRGTYDKETKQWNDVPDSINDITFNVVPEIFTCTNCTKNYKIIANELAFYKRLNIPLPQCCPDCRHERRLKARGPNELHTRSCSNCNALVQTSYSETDVPIVYCEACYNQAFA